MRIADVCTRSAVHIAVSASVREAAETMRKRHVGSLVVVEAPNGELLPVGIVTDRDIAIGVVAAGVDPDSLVVGDVMSRNLAVCGQDQSLFDAIRVMRARGVRRLPVLDYKGGLAGMLTADDIYAALSVQVHELSYALVREQVREMATRG